MQAFCSDRKRWQLLEERILAALLLQKNPAAPLRIWIAGCAGGEAAYAFAMLFSEQLQMRSLQTPVQIFATDSDRSVLAAARAGIYPRRALVDIGRERRQCFFTQTGAGYRVTTALRDMITFARHDLLTDAPFSRLDLIVLPVAPDPVFQPKVLALLHFALNPGGLLLSEFSENLLKHSRLFAAAGAQPDCYRRLAGGPELGLLTRRPAASALQPLYQQEMLSENEEYREICEQLQSSKEELSSLNEELLIINQQLQEKIGEYEVTNSDLLNLLASTRIATLFLDSELKIRRFTAETRQLFRLIECDIGRPLSDITAHISDPALTDDARAVLQQPLVRERELHAGNGRWYLRRVLPYRIRSGHTDGVVITWIDITVGKQAELNAYYQAHHDALTGLANRREFEQRLTRILETVTENSGEHALMFLDLDRFKIINDSCGHAAGDELLQQLAVILAGKLRERDMLARLGGDEFGILLEHCTLQQAQQIGEKLRRAIEEYVFSCENQSFHIGASIGLVMISAATAGSFAVIMKAADAACYVAKESGRNRLHLYHEQDNVLAQRQLEIQYVRRVRKALTENRFRLFHQQIQPLQTNAAGELHYELLVRLLDDQEQPLAPENFLAAIERNGLAMLLDRWVVQTAIDWLIAAPRHLQQLTLCAINLSGHTITDPTFLTFLLGQLERNGQVRHKLCFEITETALIANLPLATRFINELRRYGCRFALDDFGSGQASFAYLKNLPVDFLKIDGSLIRDIVSDPVDLEMIKCIHGMARATGKQTIAEFAESGAIVTMLRDIGVDYAQGYAIGRPQPLQEPAPLAPSAQTLAR